MAKKDVRPRQLIDIFLQPKHRSPPGVDVSEERLRKGLLVPASQIDERDVTKHVAGPIMSNFRNLGPTKM
jgi:hypothetical protein